MDDSAEIAAALTIQGVKLFTQSMFDAARKRSDTKRMLADLRSLSRELDVIVERAQPAFGSWDPGTFGHVSCNHGLEPNDKHQLVSDGIATVLSWFKSFAARSCMEHDAAEPYLWRFAELDDLLFWTCRYGLHLKHIVEDTMKSSGARASFKIVADRYNRLLADYEELRVRLARAVHEQEQRQRLTFHRL